MGSKDEIAGFLKNFALKHYLDFDEVHDVYQRFYEGYEEHGEEFGGTVDLTDREDPGCSERKRRFSAMAETILHFRRQDE